MDRRPHHHPEAARTEARPRAGAAVASALFAITAAAILTAAVHYMTRIDVRTTTNRESSTRALRIAEAGLAHALYIMRDTLAEYSYTAFLRGPDTTNGAIADDGLLIGRTLSSNNNIPATGRAYGGGSYTVLVTDDPADTDGQPKRDQNSRVLVTCIGYGPDGAQAQVDAVIGGITLPGFVFDGPLTISGSTDAIGRCGGIHANGAITVSGDLTTTGPVTSTSTVTGTITNPSGTAVTPSQNQPRADMPEIDRAGLCARAEYHFAANGNVYRKNSPTDSTNLGSAISTPRVGFKQGSGAPEIKWQWEPTGSINGSFCFDGNVEISGNPGSAASPMRWSLYTSGSVSISGNPYVRSYDVDSMLVVSGGDLKISGNPAAGGISYGGAMYARYQCDVSGNPVITGQLICDNEPSQPTSTISEWVSLNAISGNPQLTYNCNVKYASTRRIMSWIQAPGS